MSHIIFWRANNVRAPYHAIQTSAAAHGLPPPPDAPTPEEALRAAVRAATRKLEAGEHIEPLHKAHQRAGTLQWACGTWDKSTNARATFRHLHTWPGHVPSTPWASGIQQTLDGLRDEAATYADATTLSKYLPTVIREHLNGVPLRDGGGVYFVPRDQPVDALRAFCAAVPGLTLCVVHVSAEDARTAMAPVVEDALQEEARALLAEFRRLKDPEVLTRPSTWDKRMAELDALRQKVALFAATVDDGLHATHETLDALNALTAPNDGDEL